ncbi:serine/threonine-protein kinase [Streptomyces sp. NPDC002309]
MQALRDTDPRRIGPYEVRGRLGAGGMGEVYLAEARDGVRLAVKVVRAEHAQDRTFRARFRQEVRAAQTVGGTGTYTARVVDADTEAERPWMATEFVDGPNLRDAVLDHGALPAQAVLLLAAALGEALAAIHAKGMVHRDLKPSNILLAPDGPRVIDFGIVRALEATALTRTGAIVGSVGYVAPEQVRNGGQVGPASDVFALGAVLAYASGGREPFGEGQDPVVLLRILTGDVDLAAVPQDVRPLVESCLSEDPAARPAPAQVVEATGHTAQSLRAGLRRGWHTGAAPPGPADGAERWLPERDSGERASGVEYAAPMTVTDAPTPAPPSRRRLLRGLTGGATAAVTAGTGAWLWLRAQDGGGGPTGGPGPGAAVPRTGWEYRVQGLGGHRGPCAAPAPRGDRLYVGGADGALHAVGLDGTGVWDTDLGGVVMSPLATAEGVYCLLADATDGGAEATAVCAVGHDGEVRWTEEIEGGNGQFPVAAGDLVVVAYGASAEAGGVRAYAADGAVRWDRATGAAPTGDPTWADGVVYVGTFGDEVEALDAGSGRRLWATEAGSDTGRPMVIGDRLLVGSGGEKSLHAIGLSGEQLWHVGNEDVFIGRDFTCVAFAGLAVMSTSSELSALDPADGSAVWSFPLTGNSSLYSDPVVADDTVHVRHGSMLFGVDREGGQRWAKRIEGGASGGTHSPVVVGDRAYVPTADGITAVRLGAR